MSTATPEPIESAPIEPAASLLIGFVIAIIAISLFSAKSIVVKLMYAHGVDSDVTLALRMAMSAPLYLAIGLLGVWKKGAPGLTWRRFWQIAGIGLIGYYGASYLDLLGLEFIPAQLSRMVLFTYPVFVALIGWTIFRDRLTIGAWIALGLAYLGVAAAMLGDLRLTGDIDVRGVLLCFAAAILFASYLVLSKPLIGAVGARLFTSIAMSAASFGILAHVAVTGQLGDLAVSTPVFRLGIINAIFCTVVPSYLTSMAIGRLGGQTYSIIGSAGPLVTSVLAVFILGEAFGPYHALGLALVIGGIVLLQRIQSSGATR